MSNTTLPPPSPPDGAEWQPPAPRRLVAGEVRWPGLANRGRNTRRVRDEHGNLVPAPATVPISLEVAFTYAASIPTPFDGPGADLTLEALEKALGTPQPVDVALTLDQPDEQKPRWLTLIHLDADQALALGRYLIESAERAKRHNGKL